MSFLPKSFTDAHVTSQPCTHGHFDCSTREGGPCSDEQRVPENVECDGCNGDGVFYGAGSVVNGVFKGFTGTCFRCGGKGSQTPADAKRNSYYDNRIRRVGA